MLLASHRAAIGLLEGVVVLEGLGVMVLGVLVEGQGVIGSLSKSYKQLLKTRVSMISNHTSNF